jgi:NAD(P)-dependent dehydrogenase (short-subunit alcohol dehydrogenase family)
VSFKPFDLTGKVGLVTGGNSGIGLGMARGLAEAGADVCIWGTNEERNAAAADQLKSAGTRVVALRCDVGDRDQVKAAFAETLKQLGRVDACFANAGIGGKGTPFKDMTMDEWRAVFRINMEGVVHTFQAAIAHMIERGEGGSLVATSSGTSIFGAPRSEHYAATKAGLGALCRSIAVEHARDRIRANVIIPGWIETRMTKRAVATPKFQEKVLTRIPLRRWGQPEDFSGLAVYLASDASAYHTGDTLMIDGGYAAF